MRAGAAALPVPAAGSAARVRVRALVTLSAVAAPAIVWLAAVPLLGVRLLVPGRPGQPTLEIGLAVVVVVALIPSLGGWLLLAVLERITRRARMIWTVVALAVLALSFGLLTGPMATATRLTLGLMHVVVGAVLVTGLPRGSRRG
ncbi:DUF6069 family protein [Actinopolymorpha pittospori]